MTPVGSTHFFSVLLSTNARARRPQRRSRETSRPPPPPPPPPPRVVDSTTNATTSSKPEEEEEEEEEAAKREPTSSSSLIKVHMKMSPVKFETKSAARVEEERALFPPGNANNDDNTKNNDSKTKLLSKMRPKALDLSPNGLHKGQVGTASTDELVNLEIREKSWRECKHRASGAYIVTRTFNFFFQTKSLHRLFVCLFALTSFYARIFHSFVRVCVRFEQFCTKISSTSGETSW